MAREELRRLVINLACPIERALKRKYGCQSTTQICFNVNDIILYLFPTQRKLKDGFCWYLPFYRGMLVFKEDHCELLTRSAFHGDKDLTFCYCDPKFNSRTLIRELFKSTEKEEKNH